MKMHHLIHSTKIDFMSLFPYCAAVSLFITVVGFLVAVYRGQNLFDIDFTGGVSVQMVLKQPRHQARPPADGELDPRRNRHQRDHDRRGAGLVIRRRYFQGQFGRGSELPGQDLRRRLADQFAERDQVGIDHRGGHRGTERLGAANQPPSPAAAPGATGEKSPPAAPAKGKQSRADLPADNVLAYSPEVAQLLAANEPRSDAGGAAAPKPSVSKPANAGAATPAAAGSTAASAAVASGARTIPPAPTASGTATPSTSAATAGAGASLASRQRLAVSRVLVDPYVGGTRADLKMEILSVTMRYCRLSRMALLKVTRSSGSGALRSYQRLTPAPIRRRWIRPRAPWPATRPISPMPRLTRAAIRPWRRTTLFPIKCW